MGFSKVYKNIGLVDLASDKADIAAQAIDSVADGGKIFTVKFLKKDGSERVMNCRLGVVKHLKGGEKTLTPNYICVYDMQAQGYRSINPDTVISVNGVNL